MQRIMCFFTQRGLKTESYLGIKNKLYFTITVKIKKMLFSFNLILLMYGHKEERENQKHRKIHLSLLIFIVLKIFKYNCVFTLNTGLSKFIFCKRNSGSKGMNHLKKQ